MAQTKVKLIADGVIAQSNLNASHGITTADIGENASYLYYTDARVLNYLSTNGYDTATNIIASITDSAPSTLDTLNELAAALGDDANFSTTVTNSIATKLPLTGGTLTGGLTGTSANLTTSGTVLSLDRTGGATALVEFKIGGTVEGYLGANSTKSLIVFNESASEKLSVSNGGNLITTGSGTFAGNVTTNTAFIALGSLPALQASSIFIDSPTATINRLGVTGANTTTKGTFVISQYSSDGSLGADTVTIDSSGNSTFAGNVLITGTSDQGLRIKSGASALSYIDFSDADTGTPSGSIAYNNIVDAMTFGTGGSNTERMRITSAGNTQLSGNNLDIKGTSAGNTNIRITDSTGTVGTDSLDLINDGTAAYIWNRANTNILFGTNGTEKMRITSGGDVLIGTNGKFLQGKRNTGGVVIDMIGFGAGTDTLQIKGGTSGGANAISFYDTGGFLGTWYNGNFGIGTTSPGRKLTVTGDASGDANNLLLSNENDTDGDSASIGFSMLSNNTYVKAGIFFERTTTQGRGSLIFATNNEVNGNNVTLSDERMCIDSFGDVGIGTDDPYTGGTAGRRVLHINGTSSALMALGVGNALSYFYHDGSNLQITNLAAAGGDIILQNNGAERMRIDSSGNSNFYGNITISKATPFITLSNTAEDECGIVMLDSADAAQSAQITYDAGDNKLKFYNNASSIRMVIDSSGNVLIGKTAYANANEGIILRTDATSGGQIRLTREDNTNTQTQVGFYVHSGSNIGSITTTSSSVAYNTSSDYRLKEDLQDFNGLDKVSKIPVYDFKWKTDESRSYGVMAHELQEVLPQAVSGKKDAEKMQGVDYSKIVPLLVKSIQELKAEIELLKTQINN